MKVYLTQDEFNKIQVELELRLNHKRKEIAGRINAAKEMGDLSENAEYHSAKEEQALNEMRIVELKKLTCSAEVVSANKSGHVNVGSRVKLQSPDLGHVEFAIVGPEGVDLKENKISYESPLGKALIGKKSGEIVEIKVPQGKIKYKIVEVR